MKDKYTILLFKSPTCGPCKMFQPQLEIAVKNFTNEAAELELSFVDVSTDEGVNIAEDYEITSSGTAILFLNTEPKNILFQWDRPKKSDDIITDILNILK